MEQFTIEKMTPEDAKLAISWAESEGWNPGLNDAANYYIADPDGFLIGKLNGVPISCISVIRYSNNFNFIGLYIVHPNYRKQGFGWKTWQAALNLIPNQPAALAAVLEQVKTYEKSGFKPSHSDLRYQGIIQGKLEPQVVDLKTINFEQLCQYDCQYFPSQRSQFLQHWINQPNSQGYAILRDKEILGYGVIRKAVEGWKLAPLFAESKEVAEKIFLALASYAQGETIYIDVPNINIEGIKLVEQYKMTPMFECVRMYKGEPPSLNWGHIFGVTSLEIG